MDDMNTPAPPRWRGKATAVGLAAAGAVAGGVLASALTASAADSTTPAAPAYGYAAPSESRLTGTDAAKAKAAALKAVPAGTVYRVETDAGDAAYEAHMTKADGTLVTVKMDKNFDVTAVEDGMGLGDPRPPVSPSSSSSST